MKRLEEKWGKPVRYFPTILGENPELKALFEARKFCKESKGKEESFFSSLWKNCAEIILNIDKDGSYCLDIVMRSLDADTLEIVVQPTLQMLGFDNQNDLKQPFAFAMLENVPIFGNTPDLHDKVMAVQQEIIQKGFEFTDQDGKSHHLKFSKYHEIDFRNPKALMDKLIRHDYVMPVEIRLLVDALSGQFREYTQAAKYIKQIETALEQLSDLLQSNHRNEHELQRCLTRHPILFGTEYCRIISKHRLGSEYEMDYALEKYDGTFDLVEIEASTLKLYNSNGDPAAKLIHAEQQVLDWQSWIEEKNLYAKERLAGVAMPRGFVIIGRSSKMAGHEKKKLVRRNLAHRGHIEILTYDNLLDKCKTLLQRIRGENSSKIDLKACDQL